MSNGQVNNCMQCGAPLEAMSKFCKYCGAQTAIQPQQEAPVIQQAQTPQYVPEQQQPQQTYTNTEVYSSKSKTAAGLLAIFLGGFGVHKFYLGKIGKGILYAVFFWTYIPAFIGFIEGIIYLTSSDEKFYNKYVIK